METRLIIAYGLMLTMTLLAVAFVGYRTYFSRDCAYRRRLRKEQRAHDAGRASRS